MCQFAFEECLRVNWVSAVLFSKRRALSALIHQPLLVFSSSVSSSASSPSYVFRLCFVNFLLLLFVRLIFVSFIENRCKVISNDGRLAQGFCSYSCHKKILGPTVLGPTGCFVDKKSLNSLFSFFTRTGLKVKDIYIYIYILLFLSTL